LKRRKEEWGEGGVGREGEKRGNLKIREKGTDTKRTKLIAMSMTGRSSRTENQSPSFNSHAAAFFRMIFSAIRSSSVFKLCTHGGSIAYISKFI